MRVENNKILDGLFWRYGERVCAQGVQFIVSIVLARMLTPESYGYVGLVIVFISIAMVFVQSGFGNALIQRENAKQVDFSSVFYFNILFSIFLFLILQLIAPLIASFYDATELLTPVIRVLSISVILAGINSVQQAYVSRQMIFKKFFFATIIGTVISAFIGIYAAYQGLGVWALVIQQLTDQTIGTIVLWFTVRWRPTREFSFANLKEMFSFGWKLLCSNLIDTIYNNIYSLIIGKFYDSASLGYYNRGKNIPNMIITSINSSIQSVLFPAYAKEQRNIPRVKQMVRKSIITSTFLIFPCMSGLATVAYPLTVVLLTEKWIPCVKFMQYCCFIYAFWPIHTANLQAISAIGRSDIYLRLEIIKKVLGIIILVITLPFGLEIMMIGRCINTAFASILNATPNRKLLDYSYLEQIKDILPNACLSIAMCIIISLVNYLNISSFLKLCFQVPLGVIIYCVGAKLFHLESSEYLFGILKNVNSETRNTGM